LQSSLQGVVARSRRTVLSNLDCSVMAKPKLPKIHDNPFEKELKRLAKGDPDPNKIFQAMGSALNSWEIAEVAFAYLFSDLAHPTGYGTAARRAYGSVIAARGRREMISAAAETFFHLFPDKELEREFDEYLAIYQKAMARRNEIAHGVVHTPRGKSGFYLEANNYGLKRGLDWQSPYAYTSQQIAWLGQCFGRLRWNIEGFRRTLKEHFQSSDPKSRARY
jgi:hypothetical protein